MMVLLKKISSDYKIAISASAIIAVEPADDESTWITLVTGEKFVVSQFSEDILLALAPGKQTVEVG